MQRAEYVEILQAAERLAVLGPAITRQPFAMCLLQAQTGMRDIRQQRHTRQALQHHARRTGIQHRQGNTRRGTGRLFACCDQQPVGRLGGRDEVLVAGQDQAVEAGLHIRRAHATLLGHTQRAQAGRCRRPQGTQRRLVAGQERTSRRAGQAPTQ